MSKQQVKLIRTTPAPRPEGFKKGHPGYKKGRKNLRTLQWEEIEKVVLGEGFTKAVDVMMKLKGEAYIRAFTQLLRYFKPMLGQLTVEGQPTLPPTFVINHTVMSGEETRKHVKDTITRDDALAGE